MDIFDSFFCLENNMVVIWLIALLSIESSPDTNYAALHKLYNLFVNEDVIILPY